MEILTQTDGLVPLPAPGSIEEAGLSLDMFVQLSLKSLHFLGELSAVELGVRLGVTFAVVSPAIEMLKVQRLVEIVGGTHLGQPSYRYRVTQLGRERAALFLDTNMYTGRAPVPIAQYRRYMQAFSKSVPRDASQEDVRQAFSHLVLSDRVLDQLGPAVNAAHSLFVYGPPGNGKTVVSQAIGNLLRGEIHIPFALEIDGNIVQVFDPVGVAARTLSECLLVQMRVAKVDTDANPRTASSLGIQALPTLLLIKNGDQYRTVELDYHGGLRYAHLERVSGTTDRLRAILAPRSR